MAAPWDSDEIAWARECAAAGDTVEEIAEWSGRTVDDVRRVLVGLRKLTRRERLAASLWAAGFTLPEVGRELFPNSLRPRSLGWDTLRRVRAKGYAVASHQELVARARQEALHG